MSRSVVTLPWDVLEQILLSCAERLHFRDPAFELEAARQLARTLHRCSLVARDWHAFLRPLLWRELSFGSVDRPSVKSAITSCLSTLRAEPALAAGVLAVRLATPPGHPPRHSSPSQKEENDVLAELGSILIKLERLQEVTLVGPMVAVWISQRRQDVVARPTRVVLSGPPSDLYLSLRNLTQVTHLHLDHPTLARPAFLGRVHEQLDHLTSLRVDHYALSPSSHPALTLLLSGDFGRRLEHLALHLGPDCPTPNYSRGLLALAPNIRSLSLSPQGLDVEALPPLLELTTLHLYGADQLAETTHQILKALAAGRHDIVIRARLPRLAVVQTDLPLERWKTDEWRSSFTMETDLGQTPLEHPHLTLMRPETAPKDPQQLLSEDREAALVERHYAHEWQQLDDLKQRKKAADKAAFARRTVCPPRPFSTEHALILRQPTSGLAGPPKP